MTDTIRISRNNVVGFITDKEQYVVRADGIIQGIIDKNDSGAWTFRTNHYTSFSWTQAELELIIDKIVELTNE